MLVVSEVCAGDTVLEGLETEAREATERLVGRSAAGAAVGVAEENSVRPRARRHFMANILTWTSWQAFAYWAFVGPQHEP